MGNERSDWSRSSVQGQQGTVDAHQRGADAIAIELVAALREPTRQRESILRATRLCDSVLLSDLDPQLALHLGVALCSVSAPMRTTLSLTRHYAQARAPAHFLEDRTAVADNPGVNVFTHYLVRAYAETGRPESALALSRERLRARPNHTDTRLRHAVLCLCEGHWEEAFAVIYPIDGRALSIGFSEAATILRALLRCRVDLARVFSEFSARGHSRALAGFAVASTALASARRLCTLVRANVSDSLAFSDELALQLLRRYDSAEPVGHEQVEAIEEHLLPSLSKSACSFVASLLRTPQDRRPGWSERISGYFEASGRQHADVESRFECELVARTTTGGIAHEIDLLGDSLRGPSIGHRIRDILSRGGVVVSSGSISRAFYLEHLQALDPAIFTFGAGDGRLSELCQVTRLADLLPVVYSAEDLAAARVAKEQASTLARSAASGPLAESLAEVTDDVLGLGLEDLFIGAGRVAAALRRAVGNVRTVLVVLPASTAIRGLGQALFVKHATGAKVFVAFDGRTGPRQILDRLGAVEAESTEELAIRLMLGSAAPADSTVVPAARLLQAIVDGGAFIDVFGQEPEAPHGAAGDGCRLLLAASLGHPSNVTAAREIARELGDEVRVLYVDRSRTGDDYAGTAQGVPRFPPPGEAGRAFCVDLITTAARRALSARGDAAAVLWGTLSRLVTFLSVDFPRTVWQAGAIRSVCLRSNVSCLVTLTGRFLTLRAATSSANRCGVRTVDVQVLAISAYPRNRRSLASTVTMMTEEQIEIYRTYLQPVPEQRIVRVGSPLVGFHIRRVRHLSVSDARGRHGLPLDAKVVMFASQHGRLEANLETFVPLLASALANVPEAIFVIKLHPSSPPRIRDDVSRLVDERGLTDRVRVVHEADVYELIVASDVVLTQFSSVGLESAILDRPTLVVNLSGVEYPVDLHAMGVAELATNEAEVREKVVALLFNDNVRAGAALRRDAYFTRNPELREGSGKLLAVLTEQAESPLSSDANT